ncbi:stealth conserved region 3 domain-containing protein, partial [Streptomyces sp. NRRL B-12105]
MTGAPSTASGDGGVDARFAEEVQRTSRSRFRATTDIAMATSAGDTLPVRQSLGKAAPRCGRLHTCGPPLTQELKSRLAVVPRRGVAGRSSRPRGMRRGRALPRPPPGPPGPPG